MEEPQIPEEEQVIAKSPQEQGIPQEQPSAASEQPEEQSPDSPAETALGLQEPRENKEEARNEASEQIKETPKQAQDIVKLIEQPEWKTILYDLVNTEKMDPWDIDICLLADKFLQKINTLKGTDLRLPANAILASAIMLRFKARVLKVTDIEDELERQELEEQQQAEFAQLEGELPELTVIRKVREGKVSLDDLVNSIERMLETSKKKSRLKITREEKEELEFRLPVLGGNIEQLLDDALALTKKHLDSQGIALFSQMVEGKETVEIINTFIPVLLLMNRKKLTVWQDDFFGEVFVSLYNEGDEKANQ